MGKIYCVIGKSSTGKDTIFKRLIQDEELNLCRIVPYTTRPIREGEKEGQEYYFTNRDTLMSLQASGKVIEHRSYNTIHGVWDYFTVDTGIDLDDKSYITIGTLESYIYTRDYFGQDRVVPIYIEVEDGERLARALHRERKPENGRYEEMCRRFLADSKDFSEEKLDEAGIFDRFENINLEECIEEIKDYIRGEGQ